MLPPLLVGQQSRLPLNPVFQYRSFDHLYLFKVKDDNSLVLKVFDVTQKCLFKKVLSPQSLEAKSFQQSFTNTKNGFSTFLETLIQKQLLPQLYAPTSLKAIKLETCLKTTSDTIQQLKSKISLEGEEVEKFCCPITMDVFQEPVIDEHGHTFEKAAIERHLDDQNNKNQCPINRQPIYSLTRNLVVQQFIEASKKEEPIPNFALFRKKNLKLAKKNLQMAQTFFEEKEYTEALDSYTKAFVYTRRWADYVGLPSLFEKMEETEKATLAYLYLAKYQLEDRKVDAAIQTLETCKANPYYLQIDLLLLQLYELQNQSKKVLELSTKEALSTQAPEQIISLYQRLLTKKPEHFELYPHLAPMLKTPHERAHLLLKGACHALEAQNYKIAEQLSKKATDQTQDSFIDQLVFLDLLRKQKKDPAVQKKLLFLAQTFEKNGLIHQALKAYKMLFQIERKIEHCKKILDAYGKLQKPQKHIEWSITYMSLYYNDSTPLHGAAEKGHLGVVKALLKAGANIEAQNCVNCTPLHKAAEKGHVTVVEALLKAGANIEAQSHDIHVGFTPLHRAAKEGHVGVVEALLKAGANIEAQDGRGKGNYSANLTPLHWAAWEGHVGVVEALLKAGANTEAQDNNKNLTPLHLAAQEDSDGFGDPAGVVEALLKAGANLEAQDTENRTPLHFSAKIGWPDIVKALLKAGANIEAQDNRGCTPLHQVTMEYDEGFSDPVGVVGALLKAGANIEAQDNRGCTPLHFAAMEYNNDLDDPAGVVKALLKARANIEAQDNKGRTPLHFAATKGNLGALEALFKAGANIEAQDNRGCTPLHLAAMEYNNDCDDPADVVKALLKAGANIEAQDNRGCTPLHLAAKIGWAEVVKALLKAGANIEAQDNKGCTPLHFAAIEDADVVKALLKGGASLDVKNEDGETPFDVAKKNENKVLAELLEEATRGRKKRRGSEALVDESDRIGKTAKRNCKRE